MNGFFRKIEKFFVNLLVIILIIMISTQFLLKNETAYQRIKELEFAARRVLNWEQGEQVIEVSNINPRKEKAYLIIDLLQDLSLSQVWVVVNGERIENFSRGIVKISVKEGDLLALDTTYYSQALWFEITALSNNIAKWNTGDQFRVYREQKKIGIVQFYEKL